MVKFIAASCSVFVALAFGPSTATGQPVSFPSTVRMVVPFAVGGGTDAYARAVALQLGPRLGTNVIVENRLGAGSLIGTAAVAKGPRDGSMLLFTSASLVTSAATARSVPFDVIADLVPAAFVMDSALVVGVSAKSGIKTPAELVAAARAHPDGLSYGSSGVGGFAHMAAELLNDAAKIKVRHIPYKGTGPAVVDLAAGTIDMTVGNFASMAPMIQSGRVVAVGVTTPEASPSFPGLPPMAPVAPGYNVSIWYGVFAPSGTPLALVQRLNREIIEISKSPELREIMKTEGAVPVPSGLDELARRVRNDYAVWKKLAADKQLVAE